MVVAVEVEHLEELVAVFLGEDGVLGHNFPAED